MANKAVFLDRDDTLIQDPGYISHPDQVHLLPGAAAALMQLKKMGYQLILVTNQSAIARGIISEERLEQIHNRLKTLLGEEGVALDAIYYCPYHPDGVIPKFRKESDLRKPNPGMLLKAANEMNINLNHSWIIGDSYRDVAAGMRAGCKTILIDSASKAPMRKPSDPVPDHKAVNIRSAVNIVRMFELERKPLSQPEIPVAAPQEAEPTPASAIEEQDAPVYSPTPVTPEAVESAPVPAVEPQAPSAQQEPESSEEQHEVTESLPSDSMLHEILHLLKSRNRQDLYEEFSFARVLAMLTQTVALFFVIISVWFWLDSDRPVSSAQMMVAYALLLQLVTITLLLVRKDR